MSRNVEHTVCVFSVPFSSADMCRQEYIDLHQRYLVRGEQMLNEWQLRKIPRRTGTVTVKPNRQVTGSEVCCRYCVCRAMSGRAGCHATIVACGQTDVNDVYVHIILWQPLLQLHSLVVCGSFIGETESLRCLRLFLLACWVTLLKHIRKQCVCGLHAAIRRHR